MNVKEDCITSDVFQEKKKFLLYSLYLALGSVVLYVFITVLYTLVSAVLWKYSEIYILSSFALSAVLFLVGILCFFTCYGILSKKKYIQYTAPLACFILIIYLLYLLIFHSYAPYTVNYLLILAGAGCILLILTLYIWKKKINK